MSETVEVPKQWLHKLIELGNKTDVYIDSTSAMPAQFNVKIDKTQLLYLKGYIGSATMLFDIQPPEVSNE